MEVIFQRDERKLIKTIEDHLDAKFNHIDIGSDYIAVHTNAADFARALRDMRDSLRVLKVTGERAHIDLVA